MINITKEKDIIKITGHSEPNICAGVSSVMYTTTNALLKYNKDSIDYNDDTEKDEVVIAINKRDCFIDLLIDNMFDMFKDIKEDFESEVSINIIR